MKRHLLTLGLAVAALSAGCVSTGVALANAEAGNAFATYELNRDPATLQGLQDMAKALPDIPLGKVSAYQLGVIQGELNKAKIGTSGQLASQIGSMIALVSQAGLVSNGGVPTAEAGIISADCADAAAGINNAIAYWQGQNSVPKATTSKGW